MEKLSFFWNELKSTFWFLPIVIIVVAIAIALSLLNLDQNIDMPEFGIWKFIFIESPDSARSVLTTISSAMIGVTGTVFSVTLVALTIASNQFGSRLIKNFMHIRLNQVVLGTYVATFVYCLFVLNAIKENDNIDFIPRFSILVALVVATCNIILLVIFIHGIAVMIQADNVIANISASISKDIDTLFPEKIGDEQKTLRDDEIDNYKNSYSFKTKIASPRNGYLQYIDGKSLMEKVVKLNGMIELYFRPGYHLVKDEYLATLYTNEELDTDEIKKIQEQFIFGTTRTAQQDMEFSIHQMVEIASRALSPGINDPYTAISCIDYLSSTLSYLSHAQFPSPFRFDEEKKLRVIANTMKFEGLMDASFNQIREYAKGSTIVIFRLMDALITINKFTEQGHQKEAIRKHARMVMNLGKVSIAEQSLVEELEEKYEVFKN